MAKYIELEVALALIKPDAPEDEKVAITIATAKKLIRTLLDRAPAADVAPVMHGRWEAKGYVCGESEFECSACHKTEWRTTISQFKFCPFCGAELEYKEN